EIDICGLRGIASAELAIGDREFDHINSGRSSTTSAATPRAGLCACWSGRRAARAAVAAKIEPPRPVAANHDIPMRADQVLVLTLPVRAVIRAPHTHPVRPAVGDEPVLALPMDDLGPFTVVVGDGIPLGFPLVQVRTVGVAEHPLTLALILEPHSPRPAGD